jgi:hypothetical protein
LQGGKLSKWKTGWYIVHHLRAFSLAAFMNAANELVVACCDLDRRDLPRGSEPAATCVLVISFPLLTSS